MKYVKARSGRMSGSLEFVRFFYRRGERSKTGRKLS